MISNSSGSCLLTSQRERQLRLISTSTSAPPKSVGDQKSLPLVAIKKNAVLRHFGTGFTFQTWRATFIFYTVCFRERILPLCDWISAQHLQKVESCIQLCWGCKADQRPPSVVKLQSAHRMESWLEMELNIRPVSSCPREQTHIHPPSFSSSIISNTVLGKHWIFTVCACIVAICTKNSGL